MRDSLVLNNWRGCMEISEDTYRWIWGWANFQAEGEWAKGYSAAMQDILEELEEFNDDISKDNSTQHSK